MIRLFNIHPVPLLTIWILFAGQPYHAVWYSPCLCQWKQSRQLGLSKLTAYPDVPSVCIRPDMLLHIECAAVVFHNTLRRRNVFIDISLAIAYHCSNSYIRLGVKVPGPRFNIKMTSYQYRKSHCGDKTILRPSYLHNGISYTGKTTSLYWIRAQKVLWTHW